MWTSWCLYHNQPLHPVCHCCFGSSTSRFGRVVRRLSAHYCCATAWPGLAVLLLTQWRLFLDGLDVYCFKIPSYNPWRAASDMPGINHYTIFKSPWITQLPILNSSRTASEPLDPLGMYILYASDTPCDICETWWPTGFGSQHHHIIVYLAAVHTWLFSTQCIRPNGSASTCILVNKLVIFHLVW